MVRRLNFLRIFKRRARAYSYNQNISTIRDLSKVHISEPEGKCSKLESVCCSMCAGMSTKTVLYVCESGHIVCDTCRKTDKVVSNLIDCESKNLKSGSSMKTAKRQGQQEKHELEMADELYDEDFASGDHNHCSKCFHQRPKCKSVNIQVDKKLLSSRKSFSEQEIRFKTKETILKYNDERLSEGERFIPCPGIRFSKHSIKNSNRNRIQRPVTCPLTECRKMIARDLILQHFYFDHSKLPRITMNSQPHQYSLNASFFTENTTCYAIFLFTTEQICASLLHTTDAGILLNGGYKNVSFLLMGVRMPCSAETITKSHGSDSTSITLLQTESNAVKAQSSKVKLNRDTTTEETDRYGLERKIFIKNNVIMLWICKLGDLKYYYTISINRADKKLGYSFTGETIKIEDSHDPHVIWDQMECLLIQEKSLKKLVNEQNQLEISVNIFH